MKYLFALFFLTLSLSLAATDYTYESGNYMRTTLPYRKATFGNGMSTPILVVYLHGGSSKGDDNERPVAEPGTDSIANYLSLHGIDAIFLVPQCPQDKSWGGAMNAVLKGLIDQYINAGAVDADRVFLLGGSMGGTGSLSMLSAYPELFAAAMPVAADPSRSDARKVAQVPVFTVMGTADEIMSVGNMQTFTQELAENGGEFRFDIEDGWTHEMTCIQSYTTQRLDWVFSHRRGNDVSGVEDVFGNCDAKPRYYTIDGIEIAKPLIGQPTVVKRGGKTFKVVQQAF